ncbi:hypothetical protein ACFVYT_29280 [Streptomyces sp. NPDC058290]|uniref:hypothetical protein n=1 Tax=Streptomyces sp. NPDC058290 TaxID=3346426 RepID=UPI0036EE5DE2
MRTDVLIGWTSETLGSLTVLTAAAVWSRLRRRRPPRPDKAAGRAVRTCTLLGAREADG